MSEVETEVESIDKGIRALYRGILWRAILDLARYRKSSDEYQSAYRFFYSTDKPKFVWQITFQKICDTLGYDRKSFVQKMQVGLALIREQKKRRYERGGF